MSDKARVEDSKPNPVAHNAAVDKTDARFDAGAGDKGHNLAQSLYARPEDFRQSIILAQNASPDSMKQFDGKSGRPELVTKPEQATGQDLVTKLPADFSSIPESRRKEIAGMAGEMLRPYTKQAESGNRDADGRVSFNEIGAMMDRIGKRTDLTELEKCRLWSDIRIGIGAMGLPVEDCDEPQKMKDSWHGAKDPWHALITMDDGYHGNRLINMTPEQATKAIIDHENGADNGHYPLWKQLGWQVAKFVRGVNQGDVEASEGQLKALRALRETGRFADYATEWKKQFVRPDVDANCRPRW